MKDPVILAIDFETANRDAISACQLGVVRLEAWQAVDSASWLIRPPEDDFIFTDLHGISWEDVQDCANLKGLWQEMAPWFRGVDYLAAHNAPFDREVLRASLAHHGLEMPSIPFLDTVMVARQVWKIYPTKLNMVCARLNIPLNHHEALSDAKACGEILRQAHGTGWEPE